MAQFLGGGDSDVAPVVVEDSQPASPTCRLKAVFSCANTGATDFSLFGLTAWCCSHACWLGVLVGEVADNSGGSGWRMRARSAPAEKPSLLCSLGELRRRDSGVPRTFKFCLRPDSTSGDINTVKCFTGPVRVAILKFQLSWCARVQLRNKSEKTPAQNTEHCARIE